MVEKGDLPRDQSENPANPEKINNPKNPDNIQSLEKSEKMNIRKIVHQIAREEQDQLRLRKQEEDKDWQLCKYCIVQLGRHHSRGNHMQSY